MANEAPNPEWDRILSAAAKNQFETIRRLITQHKVSASHANSVGQSALHIASLWGHVESVRVLVELGANVTAKNSITGASPLHMVAQSRKGSAKTADRIQIVECLVQAGAVKDQADNMGYIPADCPTLREEGFEELRQALLPSAPLIVQLLDEADDTVDLNALRACLEQNSLAASTVYMGKIPVMRVVVSILEEMNDGAEEEIPPIDQIENLLQCLKLLMEYGGSTELAPGVVDSNGLDESPLYQLLTALFENCLKSKSNESSSFIKYDDLLMRAAGYLIDGGAVLDDTKTAALLHQAARRNQVPFAKYCIETLHIDPNIKGRQGMTALQFAARSGQMEMLVSIKEPWNLDWMRTI